VLSALSLLLCVVAAVLWVRRGGASGDQFIFTTGGRLWWVMSSKLGINVITVGRWPGQERLRWVADNSSERIPVVAHDGPWKKWRRLGVNGENGAVFTWVDPDGTPVPFSRRRTGPVYYSTPMRFAAVRVPHWMPLALAAVLPLLQAGLRVRGRARRRRRAARRQCPSCAYDLTGNVSGTCPECGTPAAKGAA
jgi:hypothetical protein